MMNKSNLLSAMCALSLLSGPATAAFVSYNDTVGTSTGNVTSWGFGTTSGLLKDFNTGVDTGVTATLTAVNAFAGADGSGSIPDSGTDAYTIFNGIVDVNEVASYVDGNAPWSYRVDFTGLDSNKIYEFVTFANRNRLDYGDRDTIFSILDADTFTNSSSTGTTDLGGGAIKTVTGYNTETGYIVQWTGITAADGSFSVVSQNENPGTGPYEGYGMQAFRLTEVPVPASVWLFVSGLIGLVGIARKRITA